MVGSSTTITLGELVKVKPEFTKAQAGMVRFALKAAQEFELDTYDHKAITNALKALDTAQLNASRR